MAGRRRVQRSVRVSVSALLTAVAATAVAVAVTFSTAVAASAVFAAVAGAAAARILYAEVLQTRRSASRSRADQALATASVLARLRAEHAGEIDAWRLSVIQRDRSVRSLVARLRAADERAKSASSRAEREMRRADDAQHRLTEVLDAVLARPDGVGGSADEEDEGATVLAETRELPTVVDLLAWEERTSGSRADRARRHA
jgi:hypothetical protein